MSSLFSIAFACVTKLRFGEVGQTARRLVRRGFATIPLSLPLCPPESRLRIFPSSDFHLAIPSRRRTFESPFNLLIMRQGEWPSLFLLFLHPPFFLPLFLSLSLHLSSQLERDFLNSSSQRRPSLSLGSVGGSLLLI